EAARESRVAQRSRSRVQRLHRRRSQGHSRPPRRSRGEPASAREERNGDGAAGGTIGYSLSETARSIGEDLSTRTGGLLFFAVTTVMESGSLRRTSKLASCSSRGPVEVFLMTIRQLAVVLHSANIEYGRPALAVFFFPRRRLSGSGESCPAI